MKTEAWIGIVIVILIIAGIIWWVASPSGMGTTATTTPSGTTTTTGGTTGGGGTNTTSAQGINFTTPQGYALATAGQAFLTQSYIPPCDQGFDYCIYKNDSQFSGTNFESAGVSINQRGDLSGQQSCLTSPPSGLNPGYAPTATMATTTYAVSVFADLGNGAAGHSSLDNDYRLYNKNSGACTEVDTRIGQSAYGNYPAGSIEQFTDVDEQLVASQLSSIINSMTLNGVRIAWPANVKTAAK